MPITNTITLSYPFNSGTPTLSVIIPCPERENTESTGRNVIVAKSTSGINRVYDRGEDGDRRLRWAFKSIKDSYRSALIAFLDAVNWGISPVKLIDWMGATRYVRIVSQEITSIQKFEIDRGGSCGIDVHWDFDLELLDITNNPADMSQETPVPSALVMHLSDYNHPHNPLIEVTITDAATPTVIQEFALEDAHTTVYVIQLERGASRAIAIVSVSSNRNYDTVADATFAYAEEITVREELSGSSTDVTFSAALVNSGVLQAVEFRATAATETGWIIRARRVSL
jgi:hypothetical protein